MNLEDAINAFIISKAPRSTVRIKQIGIFKFLMTTKTMYGTSSFRYWRNEILREFEVKIIKHI